MRGQQKTYNTFSGVFLPTFLSIVGVILFLRLGFIVGSAGVLGTIVIILLAVSVTVATGLSLSSITTNIRLGSGGAYAIITKTLGLEVGGSVGIPLFLAQVCSVTLYLFGFAEAWRFIFPWHTPLLVTFAAFALLFVLVSISTRTAVNSQYVVFIMVAASLVAVFAGGDWSQGLTISVSGASQGLSFWGLFALFFPAVTGLMAGISLSGQLPDPKRQIPLGVLSAIGITTLLYISIVIWLGNAATTGELIKFSQIIVVKSAYPALVLAGILAASFSSALTTFIAAPRLLQALADNHVVPLSNFLSKKSRKQEPKNAIIVAGVFIFALLFTGSLDAIAPVLTMFFLITYAMINIVVFIEQSLGSVSFRPTLKIPMLVPLYGAVVSTLFMFLINAFAGIVAILFLFVMYLALVKSRLRAKEGDVRSGLFFTLAEWAAKKVTAFPESTKHMWKPSILLPVVSTRTLLGNFPLIKSIAFPSGTMTVLGLNLTKNTKTPEGTKLSRKRIKEELKELPSLINKFSKENVFSSFSKISVKDYTNGICVSLQAIKGQVFHPNMLFLPFRPGQLPNSDLERIFSTAQKERVGVLMFDRDDSVGLGSEQDVHVWVPRSGMYGSFYADRDFDLAMILAYRLYTNWTGKLTIWMCVKKHEKRKAEKYLQKLVYEARFPHSTIIHVSTEPVYDVLSRAPQGDIHIIPVSSHKDIAGLHKISQIGGKSFLYVLDSSEEDILA